MAETWLYWNDSIPAQTRAVLANPPPSLYPARSHHEAMGVRVFRTPVRAPKANSVCERFGGTLRRECLDFVIPCNERHLKLILKSWVTHFNHGRPHMSLGPGIPAPVCPSPPHSTDRHRIPAGHVNRNKPVLGGLHHEYSLEKVAA